MDLIDLMNEPNDEEKARVKKRLPKFPTFSCDPQKAQASWNACIRKDWRQLNSLGVVWYDQYAEKWFKFGPHFFDIEEFIELTE